MSDQEPTKLSTPPPPPADRVQTALDTAVDALFATIEPHRGCGNLEVEWRLCTFVTLPLQAPPPPRPSGSTDAAGSAKTVAPRILRSREKITVGVSESDFSAIEAYVKKAVVSETCPLTQSCTEDVQDGRRRNSFVVEPDGKKVATVSINKKRLCVVDMALPGCPYDLRLSVNTEDQAAPASANDAPAANQSSGDRPRNLFSRLKRRQSVRCAEAGVCYDLTRVVNSHQQTSFEVELEGSFKDPVTELTRTWVQSALERMITLATLEGIQGTRVELGVRQAVKRPRSPSTQ